MDNTPETTACLPEQSCFRKAAKTALYRDFGTHILAFLLFLGFPASFFFAKTVFRCLAAQYLPQNLAEALDFTLTLAAVFLFLFPLPYGYFTFLKNALSADRADLADLFIAFSSGSHYYRAVTLFLRLFIRAIPCFFLPLCLLAVTLFYRDGFITLPAIDFFGYDLTYTLLVTSVFALFFVAFLLYSRVLAVVPIVLARPGDSFARCYLLSHVCFFGKKRRLYGALFAILPFYILSVLTCGLFFFFFTAPYVMLLVTSFGLACYEEENSRRNDSVGLFVDECL